jgi:hypothetical protein
MDADSVHQVRSKGTNYTPRSNGNFPTASPLGAFQHQAYHHCTHHEYVGAAFWVGDRCCARVEAMFGVATEPHTMAKHNTSVSPCGRTGAGRLLHGSTIIALFVSWGSCVVLKPGLGRGWASEEPELAHSGGLQTCHTPCRMSLAPMLLTWQSACYKSTPFT